MNDQDAPLWHLNLLRAVYLLITVGLGGAVTPGVDGSFYTCLAGVVLTPLVLPWRDIGRHFFGKPGQRWR